ncbi:MAG: FMN reductase (NADPH) [Gammaproteobacteria bacterium HGW-Gammaproteobacteria-11]|nr:MAG: FMN reductase (NADPH) [Gammaproteobacteria bacterium HGW-Gammaproteobacteria-11]
MKILLIAGSPQAGARSTQVLQHIQQSLEHNGFDVDWLVLADLPAAALIHQRRDNAEIARALAAVENADGVVVAGPIYKAAPAGLIKVFLDLLPQQALSGKVLLPLATAGGAAHFLALDYSLRPVLGALGAVSIVPGLYIQDGQISFSQSGSLQFDAATQRRVEASLAQFLAFLASTESFRQSVLRPAAARMSVVN